ncbi:MAG: hypothetical protein KDI06_16635, partial [Calditrichaeota bacterium]|nr:hypothetical protein [Calditrichota bacterium]
LAVTSNQEVNALATLHFKEIFGNDNVYQLGEDEEDQENTMPAELNGRILFGKKLGPQALEERLQKGFRITSMPLPQLEEEGEGSDDNLNLFAVYPDGDVMVFTDEAENNIPEKEGILIRLQGPSAPKG